MTPTMTPRQKFLMALDGGQPPGRVPHFELVFLLTMEAFGIVHPRQRRYAQWGQMTETERVLHRNDMANLFVAIAERFEHSAIYLSGYPCEESDALRILESIRNQSGDTYCLLMGGEATYGIPPGDKMVEFAVRLAEEPTAVKDAAQKRVDNAIARAERLAKIDYLDGFMMCADYAFNAGPFLSPAQFGEFVAPYLTQVITAYRELGFYVIKHTDGNILPILDQLVAAKPHALHSLDPQAGIDIADIKRRVGKDVCLIGNVNCGLMTTGTDEECVESVRNALRHGMPGGGYIFSTSNCIHPGMSLERYELILDVWRRAGVYPD